MCLTNHIYTVSGKLFRQLLGGPIGLALTTILAEILMREFDHRYSKKLDSLNLSLELNKRYVDDLNVLTESVNEEQEYRIANQLGEEWERPS